MATQVLEEKTSEFGFPLPSGDPSVLPAGAKRSGDLVGTESRTRGESHYCATLYAAKEASCSLTA